MKAGLATGSPDETLVDALIDACCPLARWIPALPCAYLLPRRFLVLFLSQTAAMTISPAPMALGAGTFRP